jgi:hypothetical protein
MARFPYGRRSLAILATCDPKLRTLMLAVADVVDTKILEGARSREQQEANVTAGVSKTMDSRHLDRPARAVDAGPYPIIWPNRETRPKTFAKDLGRWYHWAGVVRGVAAQLGIEVRLGSDWDMDFDLLDQKFDDLPHVELPKKEA